MAHFRSPYLLPLRGACLETPNHCLVMPYAEKGSLDKHVETPQLTQTMRFNIMMDITYGLSYLHHFQIKDKVSGGVVHADLKPENVLLDRYFRAQLADFGITKMMQVRGHSASLRYSCVLMSETEPTKTDDIAPGMIVMHKTGGQLTAYWVEKEKIVSRTAKEKEVTNIINLLPCIGEQSNDSVLINQITSKYGCTPLTDMGPENGGTYFWMAPELLDMESPTTKASDIYSYALILWALWERQKNPNQQKSDLSEFLRFIFGGGRPDMTEQTSQPIKKLIKKCWRQNPEERLTIDGAVAFLEKKKARIFTFFQDVSDPTLSEPISADVDHSDDGEKEKGKELKKEDSKNVTTVHSAHW